MDGIVVAGMAVSAADPNGLWGTIKEAFASRSAIPPRNVRQVPTN